MQKCIVYNNVVESMVTILLGMKMLGIKFDDPAHEVGSYVNKSRKCHKRLPRPGKTLIYLPEIKNVFIAVLRQFMSLS